MLAGCNALVRHHGSTRAAVAAVQQLGVLELFLAALSVLQELASTAVPAAEVGVRGYRERPRGVVDASKAVTFATDENVLVPFGSSAVEIQRHRESWGRGPRLIHPLDPGYDVFKGLGGLGFEEWALLGKEAGRLGVVVKSCSWATLMRCSSLGRAIRAFQDD